MGEENFKFRIQLGAFVFEVEGDRSFVEKTMMRYEGRFLPRFQQLLNSAQQSNSNADASSVEVKPDQKRPPEAVKSPMKTEAKSHEGYGGKKDKRERSRYSRNKNRPRNSSSTRVKPAPQLPEDQKVSFAPYNPDSEHVPANIPQTSNQAERAKEKPSGGPDHAELDKIFDKISPRTHHEKILVFAYYMQNNRNRTDFTTNKIRTCYKAVNAEPAVNINQVLNHASRTGFLAKTQRGRQVRYSLTSKGKHFVERGLEKGE